ncbi:WD40 repeat-like protein, partial [Clavulina sp. PMI_390]
ASGSEDTTIRLWDMQTHQAEGEPLKGHTHCVTSVVFSPDGAVLASGSYDATIRLWDVQTQKAKGEPLTGHADYVTSVVFSPNQTLLASVSNDFTICIWNVAYEALNFVVPPFDLASQPQYGPLWYKVLKNGWLQGPNEELILWIPPSYQEHLCDQRLAAKLGGDSSTIVKLDFDHMVVGESWSDCHTP